MNDLTVYFMIYDSLRQCYSGTNEIYLQAGAQGHGPTLVHKYLNTNIYTKKPVKIFLPKHLHYFYINPGKYPRNKIQQRNIS